MSRHRIAVVGLGNLMRTDDAVGMLAIQRLRTEPRLPNGVLVIEGGTLGLDLLHPLSGVTRLLALDAVEAGVQPGTVLRFDGDDVAALPVSKSVHLLGFADLIGAMQLSGDAPGEVVVLGVQPQTIDWGTELTSTVEAALPRLIDAALQQIDCWSHDEISASAETGKPVFAASSAG